MLRKLRLSSYSYNLLNLFSLNILLYCRILKSFVSRLPISRRMEGLTLSSALVIGVLKQRTSLSMICSLESQFRQLVVFHCYNHAYP